jgi:superfamily II DNA or RNA helicase
MQFFRTWQRRAKEVLEQLVERGKDRALIAACPGAGKTRFTVSVISDWLRDRALECAIVVVPSRYLKSQWQKEFQAHNISALADIDNGTLEDRQHRGMELFDPARPVLLVTYQQVASFPDLFAVLCARHKVYAVFDEIHHADENAHFGQSLAVAFEDATFKLSLSGTPFNTKGGRLAFCDCSQRINSEGKRVNRTNVDFELSYGDALKAVGTTDDPNVVRPVTFIKWNGYTKWRLFNTATRQEEAKIIDGSRASDSLGPLLDTELENLPKMIRAAIDELAEVRQHHATAGMLIVGRDGDHCEEIAKIVRRMGIHDVSIVKYDTPGSHREIERFSKSRDRVIIAIKMISEGVDIPRLRVGVYASDVQTPMFFTQFVGRFIRWDKGLSGLQSAAIFIPEHVTLIAHAKEIEKMIADAVLPDPKGPGEGPSPKIREVIDKEGDGQMNGAITHGLFIDQGNLLELTNIKRSAGVDCDLDTVSRILAAARRGGTQVDPPDRPDEPDDSRNNDRLVGRIVSVAKGMGRADLTYDRVNAMANRFVNIQKKDKLTPITILKARAQYLERILIGLFNRGDDAATT